MSVAVVGLTSRRLGRRLAWGMVRRQKCQTLPDREGGGRPLNLFWTRSPRSYLYLDSIGCTLERHSLPAWCSCWNNLAFLWKKTKGNKKQGDPGGRKFVMPLFRTLRWISRRSSHRRVLPDRMWLAQHTRSTVPGTMTNLFTRQLRHLILSMWQERECV